MDFSLSQEHEMTQKTVRDFSQKESRLSSRNSTVAGANSVAFAADGRTWHSRPALPVRYGGQGMDYLSLGLACEELEAVDTHLRVVMSVHTGLCAMTVFQWGTEEQKQKFLVPLAKGEKIGCGVFTEPEWLRCAAMRTSPKRDGDAYILNARRCGSRSPPKRIWHW